MNINQPLRLATGSHARGSGKGCAMNVVSWENGDTTITDYPACADRMLAAVVQRVNDSYCTHREADLLCPSCSVAVLSLAHRTVGTGDATDDRDRRVVWVRLACFVAREVAYLNTDQRVMAAIEAAEMWANNPTAYAADAAEAAAYNAAYAAAAAAKAATAAAKAATAAAKAAAKAAYAAYAAAAADVAAAAYAADVADAAAAYNAADAAADAADNAAAMQMAHRLVDEFNRLTGRNEHPVDVAVVERAINAMCGA